MEEKRKRTSSFSKIRTGFYKQMAELEKKQKSKIIALSLATLLLASSLLFASTLIETSGKGKYTYVYGEYEQSISNELCFYEGIQLIDMNALANYYGIEKEETPYVSTYKINNTYVSFENNSNIAIINGISNKMSSFAQIKNGYCLIPLSSALEIFYGINIEISEGTANISKSHKTMYIIEKNPQITYNTDVSAYLDFINSKDEYIYTLLNKQNPIDKDFEPADLVVIPEEYRRKDKEIYLHEIAMMALEAMLKDMSAIGITDVYVQSAYRDYAYQNMLFNIYVESEMEKGLKEEEAIINANKYSAKPEYSEHRTGLCVDFTTKSIGGVVDDVFETTEAFRWLKENSWKYGFVLRYPEEKEAVTGYIYESWHFRFVGLEVASIMHQTGLCYEEYLEIFGGNNSLQ